MKDEIQESNQNAQQHLPTSVNRFDQTSRAYDLFPFHSLGAGKIFNGYTTLADWILEHKTVVIDGYVGVYWDRVKSELEAAFSKQHLKVKWVVTTDYLKAEETLDALIEPFLGAADAVWGTKTTLALEDLFRFEELNALLPDPAYDLNIVIGPGAALLDWHVPLVYFDLPKSVLQHRMRAGSITNLGKKQSEPEMQMYKRFYFVDWVLLNQHKQAILHQITVIADGQSSPPNWAMFSSIKAGLQKLSTSVFRVLPWFTPGAWGGQWLKQHIPDLDQEEINYAWSFELIVPENGLAFESDGNLLEVSFDLLMFLAYEAVLGRHAAQYQTEFPIRFDFLDTYDGGNLSIQCHPSLNYIQQEFGETITQDETYYILDCKEDALVYLGFQEDIAPAVFKEALEHSFDSNQEIAIDQYVQALPAHKHDLFLIPNGTVHSAGANNLVLEISATPYIFTFKMYDWVRPDLNGLPRPINIEHAFKNLNFERKGAQVEKELVSKPLVITEGVDWRLVHLPTHVEHFYDVHRLEFDTSIQVETDNCCHILMLVEGTAITIETADGTMRRYNFAETFVVPAAAGAYKLSNQGKGRAKVVKAFLKY